MNSKPERVIEVDLGPEYQKILNSQVDVDAWFSEDCQFALVLLKMTTNTGCSDESYQLVNLKTAAIRKLDQPEWSGTFAFCRRHKNGLLRVHVAGTDLRIKQYQIRGDLHLDFVKTMATFPIFMVESYELKIVSLDWGFFVSLFRETEKIYRSFDLVDKKLLTVDRRGNWHEIPDQNYNFIDRTCSDSIGYCNGSVYFTDSSQSTDQDLSLMADVSNSWFSRLSIISVNDLLMELSCQKKKLKPIKFEDISSANFLVSGRFHAVVVGPNRFQLVNSRSRKRAGSARVHMSGPDLKKDFLLKSKFIRSQLYVINRDQIQKFKICSGTPVLEYVITDNYNKLSLEPFSFELSFKRFLVFQKKKLIKTTLQQNVAFVSKSPELQWPRKSAFKIKLTNQGSEILLNSLKFDKESQTLYVFFSLKTNFLLNFNNEYMSLDLTVNWIQYKAYWNLLVKQDIDDDSQNRKNMLILLAFDLETNALNYQLIYSHLTLKFLNSTKNNLHFAFFNFKKTRGNAQEKAQLAFSMDHLKKFSKSFESDSYSGTLSVPNQLRPLLTQPRQVLQPSQPVDCKSLVALEPSSNLKTANSFYLPTLMIASAILTATGADWYSKPPAPSWAASALSPESTASSFARNCSSRTELCCSLPTTTVCAGLRLCTSMTCW